MGFLDVLLVILIIIDSILISSKIINLKFIAKQQLLKSKYVSSSNINVGINSKFKKKYFGKFLINNLNFIKRSIEDFLRQYAVQLFNINLVNEFNEIICEKI